MERHLQPRRARSRSSSEEMGDCITVQSSWRPPKPPATSTAPAQEVPVAPTKEVLATTTQEVVAAPTQKILAAPAQETLAAPIQEVSPTPIQEVSPTPVQEVPPTSIQEVSPTPVQVVTAIANPPPHVPTPVSEPWSNPAIPPLSKQTAEFIAQVRAQSQAAERPPPALTSPAITTPNITAPVLDAPAIGPPDLDTPASPASDPPAPLPSLLPESVQPTTLLSAPARTGGRRGRGPRRRLSPQAPHISSPNPQTPLTDPSSTSLSAPSSSRGRGRGRGGRPRGSRSRGGGGGRHARLGKRKRSGPGDYSDSDGGGGFSSSSEEITTLPAQSRSGRKIIQPTAPPMITLEPGTPPAERTQQAEWDQPESSGARAAARARASPAKHAHPAGIRKKPGPKRTPGASAVCRNCGRGHSPASNLIVFCDGCNAAWHQHCHDPPVRSELLAQVGRDWFCGDCTLLKEHSAVLDGKVAGDGMSLVEKRKYLKSLPPSALVGLLLHATALHPNLPIYPPKAPLFTISADAAERADADGATYELVSEELPYPRAGNGIQLPSESTCLDILVDDDVVSYSHRWAGIGEMMAEAGWPVSDPLGVRTGNAAGVRAGA